jgi:deoxycytidine triphosphate deaminase
MFLNPRDIKELLINGEKPLTSVIDITAEQLSLIDNAFSYVTDNVASKQDQGKHAVPLSDSLEANERYGLHRTPTRNEDHGWFLNSQQAYVVDSGLTITVPNEVTALLVSRPELNDNALNVLQKTFPSGYTGNLSFILHKINGNSFLEKGTKVAQLFFISSPTVEIIIPTVETTTEAPIVETTTEAPAEAPIAIVELPTEPVESIIETVETTTEPAVVAEESSTPRRTRPR